MHISLYVESLWKILSVVVNKTKHLSSNLQAELSFCCHYIHMVSKGDLMSDSVVGQWCTKLHRVSKIQIHRCPDVEFTHQILTVKCYSQMKILNFGAMMKLILPSLMWLMLHSTLHI